MKHAQKETPQGDYPLPEEEPLEEGTPPEGGTPQKETPLQGHTQGGN